VDRTGSDDDEEALLRVGAIDDCDGFITTAQDGSLRLRCLGDLVLEKVRRCKRVVSANWCTEA
jgi:hypothetical protein